MYNSLHSINTLVARDEFELRQLLESKFSHSYHQELGFCKIL